MSPLHPRPAGRFHCYIVLLLTLVVGACSTAPPEPPTPTPTPMPGLPFDESQLQMPASAFQAQFNNAEHALLAFDWMAAASALEALPEQELSRTDKQYLDYLNARLQYLRGNQSEAQAGLTQLLQSPLHPGIRIKSLNFQRYLLGMSGDHLGSARLGDQLWRHSRSPDLAAAVERSIWRDLQRVSGEQLRSATNAASEPRWRGWLELAAADATALTATQRTAAISQWRLTHPDHPGADHLPGGLNYLMEGSVPPQQVTLMLPLSGRLAPAGKAVRDGYLASYYAARARGDTSSELRILDSDQYPSTEAAYQDAVMGGAHLVIGPLSKTGVEALGNVPDRPVPILALNRSGSPTPTANTALVQLSLAPEDEAGQLAQLAYSRDARRALVIRPAGAWGSKMEQALAAQWQALGGQVLATATYSSSEDYSSSIANSLNLPASEQRARDIRSMLARNIETTARRRQDIDAVFLLAKSGAEARSLKPLLAYHYAGSLPVYATSSVYRGVADERDKDLNGLHLLETPWLLGENASLRATLSAGNTNADAYTRLNALGVDAHLLQSRFSQLQAGPDVVLRGSTGLLTLDPELKIHRELNTAVFDGGRLRPSTIN